MTVSMHQHRKLFTFVHLVLFNLVQVLCITVDSYDQIIKLSHSYAGEKYPEATSRDHLNSSSVNCFYYESKGNSSTYMNCGEQKACFVATILTFEWENVWKKQHEHWGCWPKNDLLQPNCSLSCSFNNHNEGIKFVSFCSCSGSLCNKMDLLYSRLENLTDCYTQISTTSPAVLQEQNSMRSLVITIVISSSTLLFIIACLILLSCWRQKNKKDTCTIELSQTLNEQHSPLSPGNIVPSSLDDLLHGYLIHLGYHSAIRLGTFGGETIAVKVIPPKCSTQYDNEVQIFRLLGEHPNIAKFIMCDQPLYKGNGLILLEYYQAGSLLYFIRHHTLTWMQMLNLTHSIVNGLAYLHGKASERNGKHVRPGVAHRDLNTRNILMKSDGMCVLADFGFAVRLVGKPASKFHIPVGSPRYMSPEILLRLQLPSDWKMSVKKVDIYALSLVLWEVCRSCHEISLPGSELLVCVLPYEEELGAGPSLSKVKHYVCDQKLRPKLPEQWDQSDSGVCSLMKIIHRCWQSDSKGRPDALAILSELQVLLDTAHARNTTTHSGENELQSHSDLYFQRRELTDSLDEYVYADTNEMNDSLLLKYNTENALITAPLSV